MPATQSAARSGASTTALAGVWIALFSSAVFGISGSFAKPLLEAGWTSGAAVGARMLGAALVLLVPTLVVLRGRWGTVAENAKPIALFGLFGVGVCQFSYFQAVERLNVGVALLLEYLAPVLIVLVLWARSRRLPSRLTVAGTALSLVGLVLVLDVTGEGGVDPVGVLWGVGAAIGLAVYFFVTARANDTLPPLVLATGGLFVGAALMLLLGAVRLLPMGATFGRVSFSGTSVPWWAALAGLVLMATVVAYVSGIMAARRLGSKLASFVSLTEVLFAVLWAWLLLGEMPAPIQILGGLAIVGGVLLVRADELRSPAPRPVPTETVAPARPAP